MISDNNIQHRINATMCRLMIIPDHKIHTAFVIGPKLSSFSKIDKVRVLTNEHQVAANQYDVFAEVPNCDPRGFSTCPAFKGFHRIATPIWT